MFSNLAPFMNGTVSIADMRKEINLQCASRTEWVPSRRSRWHHEEIGEGESVSFCKADAAGAL